MRILRLSLFLNYFSLAKNKKKALTIINLGIFLSIFAASSALVSLYVENKISKLEYELIINSNEKRDLERSRTYIYQGGQALSSMRVQYKNFIEFYEFIAETKFGSKIISYEDKYIPFYYDVDELLTFADFMNKEDLEAMKEYIKSREFNEESEKYHLKNMDDFYSLIQNPIISEKKLKEHKEILFNSDLKSLSSEIGDEKNLFLYEDENESYKNYIKAEAAFETIMNALDSFEEIFLSLIEAYDSEIKLINEEIIKQSRLERNWVFSIFFLQLITFIIIQFFEISSVNLEVKKFRKVLKK